MHVLEQQDELPPPGPGDRAGGARGPGGRGDQGSVRPGGARVRAGGAAAVGLGVDHHARAAPPPLLRPRVLVRGGRARHLRGGRGLSGLRGAVPRLDLGDLAAQPPAGSPRHPRQRPHDQGRLLGHPRQDDGHPQLSGHHLLHSAGSVHCSL